jgi:predicted esterase
MNLDHPQLSPLVNRTRRKSGSLAIAERKTVGIPQPAADPENPYIMTHIGLYDGSIKDEAGDDRPFVLYIPSTMKTSGNSMIVFIPDGEKPEVFFRRGFWKEALERHAISTYFISAPKGWRTDDPGFEMDVATKILAEIRSMEYYPSNAPGVYCLGFGAGANIAAVFSIIHVSVLAAWGAWGDTQLNDELIRMIGGAPSDCDQGLYKSQIPLPTFIVGRKETNTLDFFRKSCRAKDEYLHNGFARIYRQQPKPGESYINDQAVSEVWYALEEDAAKLGFEVMVEKMTAFVEDYKRWGGEGNGPIRKTLHLEELGFIKTEAVLDGLKRQWWVFEPSAYKRQLKKKYPLVVAIHGFSCSGEFFAGDSCWHEVGEERGVIVVYPTAYPFERSASQMFNGKSPREMAATPSWNSGRPAIETDPNGPDEISFFKQMIAILESKYPIDPERIYVTGHSNGSRMTQHLMRYWPEKFAGFAPVGAMECTTEMFPEPDDGYLRNVWYFIGEFDYTSHKLEEGNPSYLTVNNLCNANKIDFNKRKYYESGIYLNTIVRDERAVPLVRFTGVANWPHTYSPEVAFMVYDEFFSRFCRKSDGTLVYLA